MDHVEQILADASAKGTAFDVAPPRDLQQTEAVIPLKRQRDPSEDRDSSGEQEDDDQPRGGDKLHGDKPARIDDSELPWYNQELTAKETENPAISENRRLLCLYGKNISSVKQVLHIMEQPFNIYFSFCPCLALWTIL